jgi:hypothetical protein
MAEDAAREDHPSVVVRHVALGTGANGLDTDRTPATYEERPLAAAAAARALARCAQKSVAMMLDRRLHQPEQHVGSRYPFADGTTPVVYRETVADRPPSRAPVVLVVRFRLRRVRGEWGHAAFRAESVLNTVLFAGFPGFVSKLWFRHDERGQYRGLYEWDGSARATDYVRALWWALAVVSALDSIYYAIIPDLRRDQLLRDPTIVGPTPPELGRWWRLLDGPTADG